MVDRRHTGALEGEASDALGFIALLSNVRQREEKLGDVLQQIAGIAEDRDNTDIKQALEARSFLRQQQVASLDQCFKLLNAQPMKTDGRLHDIFVEDFKKEAAAIEGPVAKRLFVLSKINNLMRLHANEYGVMIAMADFTKHHGVAVILEACQAQNNALADRARDAIRSTARERISERVAARGN